MLDKPPFKGRTRVWLLYIENSFFVVRVAGEKKLGRMGFALRAYSLVGSFLDFLIIFCDFRPFFGRNYPVPVPSKVYPVQKIVCC